MKAFTMIGWSAFLLVSYCALSDALVVTQLTKEPLVRLTPDSFGLAVPLPLGGRCDARGSMSVVVRDVVVHMREDYAATVGAFDDGGVLQVGVASNTRLVPELEASGFSVARLPPNFDFTNYVPSRVMCCAPGLSPPDSTTSQSSKEPLGVWPNKLCISAAPTAWNHRGFNWAWQDAALCGTPVPAEGVAPEATTVSDTGTSHSSCSTPSQNRMLFNSGGFGHEILDANATVAGSVSRELVFSVRCPRDSPPGVAVWLVVCLPDDHTVELFNGTSVSASIHA